MAVDTKRTNRHEAYCEKCGTLVSPGEGHLYRLLDAHDEDDFERVCSGDAAARWAVECLDETACQGRIAAAAEANRQEREARRLKAQEEAAAAKVIRDAKQKAWADLTAGLERCDAKPDGATRTGERFDGGEVLCEKLQLADGGTGWLVSWIGDSDGHYYLLPAAAKESAEAEKTRLHRVWQWWRPQGYGAESYPGPGVPLEQLTTEERAEVEMRTAGRYAAVEADWQRNLDRIREGLTAAKDQLYKHSRQGPLYPLVSAHPEAAISFEAEGLSDFCRRYADSKIYSRERDALFGGLKVTVTVTLPAACYTRGRVRAAVAKLIPARLQSGNNFVELRLIVVPAA